MGCEVWSGPVRDAEEELLGSERRVLKEAVLIAKGLGSSCWGAREGKKAAVSGVTCPGAGEGPLSSTLQLEPTVLLLGPLSHASYCSSCQLQNELWRCLVTQHRGDQVSSSSYAVLFFL